MFSPDHARASYRASLNIDIWAARSVLDVPEPREHASRRTLQGMAELGQTADIVGPEI